MLENWIIANLLLNCAIALFGLVGLTVAIMRKRFLTLLIPALLAVWFAPRGIRYNWTMLNDYEEVPGETITTFKKYARTGDTFVRFRYQLRGNEYVTEMNLANSPQLKVPHGCYMVRVNLRYADRGLIDQDRPCE